MRGSAGRKGRTARSGLRGWEPVATWYDELVGDRGSEYHREVVIPGALRLLEPARGEKILDAASGQGVFARAIAERGASVVAIEISASLVAAARERGRERGVEHVRGDARRIAELVPPSSFDGVVAILALANVAPLGPVFSGVAHALRDGGRFVAVVMHPCFRVPRASAWGWDEERRAQYRRVDRYLSTVKVDVQVRPGADPSLTVPAYHRPLEAYVNGLAAAGLSVDRLEEWTSHKTSPAGPRKRALDESRDEIPMFLALRALKARS